MHPFFGPLDKADHPAVASACRLLLKRCIPATSPWHDRALEDLAFFLTDVDANVPVDGDQLDKIRAKFSGSLEDAPAAAMVTQRSPEGTHRKTANKLSAWTLAAAICRQRQDPLDNVYLAGLDAMRRLKSRAPKHLGLLEPLPETPPAILERLQEAATMADLPKKVRTYFDRIAALLKAVEEDRPRITRDPGGIIALDTIQDDNGQTLLKGGFQARDTGFSGPLALQKADRVPVTHAVQAEDGPQNVAPLKVAGKRGMQAAKATARRGLALPSETDPLTPHEVRTLVNACEQNESSPAHQFLLALLCFGQAISKDPTEYCDLWRASYESLGVRLTLDLPEFDSLFDERKDDSERSLYLAGPAMLDVALFYAGIDAPPVTAALSDLRPLLSRSLVLGRIARFKRDWLRRAGADPAIIGFLTAQVPETRAQMFYTTIENFALQSWHTRFLREGLGLEPALDDEGLGDYGSRLQIPERLLKLVFEEQRVDLRRLKLGTSASVARTAEAHNSFALYTLMMLYAGTGHRPVGRPFEFLSDFDIDTGLLWISDKTGRGGRGTRLVALPEVARAQVRHWREHLERLAKRLASTRPDIVTNHIAPALSHSPDAHGPLFFFLTEKGAIIDTTAAAQKKELKPVLPTALNWARHILRSNLLENVHGDVIDAFLGHAHIGEDSFSSTSSLSLQDLFMLSDRVESILHRFGICTVESPL